MQPIIIDKKRITLLGMSFYGDPFDTHAGWDEDNQIGLLWKRLMGFLGKNQSFKMLLKSNAFYELHIYSDETNTKGLFEIFVGVEFDTEGLHTIPPQLSIKNLPETQYAVFTFVGEQINKDWEKVLQDWLSTSEYKSSGTYSFQYYDQRFKGLDNLAESTLDVYIPITKQHD